MKISLVSSLTVAMRNKYLVIFSITIIAIIAVYLAYFQKQADSQLDVFAQCLADKGIIMYGADWCSHCQSEKQAFGDSFRLVPYIECPEEPQKCLEAGITGYPTWIFFDGEKLEGEQGIEKLSKESGCLLR